MKTYLACLLDQAGFNGIVLAWATGEDPESAIAALRDKVFGKVVNTASDGRIEVDEDVWDQMRSIYDGDLTEEDSPLSIEVVDSERIG